ncbi:MAG TPA: hypothetical protein VK836_20930 [Streptosporangiaceae bacterium]|nr:hypothetical protein [Streptosporangiaceae bacterium]
MSVPQPAKMTGLSVRTRLRRFRRSIVAAVAVLPIVGAILLWGPIGLGNGPLGVRWDGTVGWLDPGETPAALVLPLFNSGGSPAVVDSVELVGGTPYATPRLAHIEVVSQTSCAGAWPAQPDGHGFALGGCRDARDQGPLLGRSIGPYTAPDSRGVQAVAIAAAPRPGTCWVISKIVIHYHVGLRHYAATDVFTIAVCGQGASSKEAPAIDAATGIG